MMRLSYNESRKFHTIDGGVFWTIMGFLSSILPHWGCLFCLGDWLPDGSGGFNRHCTKYKQWLGCAGTYQVYASIGEE